MNTKIILAAVIGIVIGAGGVFALSHDVDHENDKGSATEMTMHDTSMNMQGEMDSMTGALSGKTGDAFDQAFLTEMIKHHQGAVAMAQLALQNAKHQEIKDLAQKIITAQNAEITEMQGWGKSWYGQ